jgi:replication factor C subunit 3/5
MFLVDKYYHDSNSIACHQEILEKLLDTFDAHNQIYENIDDVMKQPFNKFSDTISNLENGTWRYANFQHIIVYGNSGCGKEYLVNKLLSRIYGKNAVDVKDVEYTICGYGNTKTKVNIKQSKYHIVIEPNSNGFDKYLIQEIIQDYAKIELLNILKYKKLFKIVVINKIDNLSNYAQASLRRTMEKYANTCKFIFICNQLSKIMEPIRSRCLLIRIPLSTECQIMKTLLHISHKENIKINNDHYCDIIKQSEKKINLAIWLLEIKKYNINYDINWINVIDNIVYMIIDEKKYNKLGLLSTLINIKKLFYKLFITNIKTRQIISKLLIKLLNTQKDIKIKMEIIEITSIFETRISQGTRHIIHIEAYIIRLIYLFYKHNKGEKYFYNLDTLEI